MTNSQPRLHKSRAGAVSEGIELVAALAAEAIKTGQPCVIAESAMLELNLPFDLLRETAGSYGCEVSGPFNGASDDGNYYLIEEALILPEWPYGVVVSLAPSEVRTAAREFSSWLDETGTGFRVEEYLDLGAIHIRTTDFGLAVAFVDEHGGMILTADETARLFIGARLPQNIIDQSQRRTPCATSTAIPATSRRSESSSRSSTQRV
ncbi:hypothetical protein [Bosea thiooxidans]|uniref:hypothetical protein n=1 Tax=Bosea thiooxidans TaxID=53254 RepID=UPI0009A57EB6|nr:hypothetical protein [Bosea thiooxidans]